MSRAELRGAASLIAKSRRRTVAAAVGALAAGLVAAVVVLSTTTGSSRGAGPAADATGSAAVQRRDLVATDTESGTLGYADPQTVFNRLSGTLTWLPAVGRLIRPGQALYKVDGAPVVLFDGTTPAYRDLSPGVSEGADVKELNANLVRLGYDPSREITIDDSWQAATTAAVETWQNAHSMAETGAIPLGQIAFLPGAQRITAVDTTLGSTGGSSAGAGAASASGADYAGGSSPPEFVDLSSSTTTTPTTAATTPSPSPTATPPRTPSTPPAKPGTRPGKTAVPSTEAALLALLRAETLELQQARSSRTPGASTGTGSGSGAGAAATGAAGTGAGASADPILQTSSTHLVVSVDLDATKQSEATVGEPVTVQMPTGKVVRGKITEVSPVAASSSSSSSSASSTAGSGSGSTAATIPVTIALRGRQARTGLDQAAVSVDFEQQVERHVLSVPVTALLATAGGGYEVQQAAAPHKLIRVTPGLFAAGFVQISGAGIVSGLRVTDSQG